MAWIMGDLSNFNTAKSPWYNIGSNGTVDIGQEHGGREKISLTPDGMKKIVKKWLEEYQPMPSDVKDEIKEILDNKSTY
jgi:3-oxoacyl-ACP reductase-like protein